MILNEFIKQFPDYYLFASCLFILGGSIFITIRLRFVQLRVYNVLFSFLKNSFFKQERKETSETISPHRALFTAMSTTLGISTIVAPVIAINLGGPGALLCFLLTSFFGSAATFVEVNLCIQHRKKLKSGIIMGGPMQYMEYLLSPSIAKWYAVFCLLLMVAWSGTQANQLTAILDSPLLGTYRMPTLLSGGLIAIVILIILLGGIKRIGSFSAKLIPIVFTLYIGASLWILFCNANQLGIVMYEMFQSAISPSALAGGSIVGGIVSTLRWGIFKGTQACEAGIGTQAIPHSMAETKDPINQGALAMLSTYTAGVVAFLSGCVTLVTNTWQDPELPMGINMIAASFNLYFSSFGIAIIILSAFLFGFGTILGNSYNGGQCFAYLTDNKKKHYYLTGTTLLIFIGSTIEVKTFWYFMDLILASMAIPHMIALILHVVKKRSLSIEASY
jgi:alanine or glycine:cation symporter, AGCS family